MQADDAWLREQNRVLVRLAKSRAWRSGDLESSLREITEAAARTLGVQRVNVWLFSEDRSRIRCIEHFELSSGKHTSGGGELTAADHPNYFRALEEERAIVADDANADPQTREFSDEYLRPHGIGSMLDAPIRWGGRVTGIICHEHVGPPRHWTTEEQNFAGTMADYASLAFEHRERKLVEEALRESEERQRLVLENALDAVVAIDSDSRVTSWNSRAEVVFGWSARETIGRPVHGLIIPERYQEAHLSGMKRFLKTGEGPILGRRIEITALHRDGHEFLVELNVVPTRFRDSWVFTAFARDITERIRAEDRIRKLNIELEDRVHERTEQLEKANRELEETAALLQRSQEEMRVAKEAAEEASRAKSDFLAQMSHELRTPMNGILGMAELLLMNAPLEGENREYLDCLKESADTLLRLLNDILDFSKVEAGKLELESIRFSLRDTVGDTLQALRVRAREKNLELTSEIDDDVSDRLRGDPGRLRQILVNLVGNAIKFTEKGRVEVDVSVDSRTDSEVCLHFAIRDTGIGISKEKLDAVFGAFTQADSSISRRFGGTGLGLAISAQLVSLMDGRTWVESREGEGSTFHFTARFLLAKEPAKAVTPGGEGRPSRSGLGRTTGRCLRVLVAEDNKINRRLMKWLLTKRGHEVVLASNGREALEAFDRAPFDLVLMDVRMPDMNGFEATAAIREKETGNDGHVPIVALTAHALKGDRARCLEAGMDAYIAKPIQVEELYRVIENLVPGASVPAEPVVSTAAGPDVFDRTRILSLAAGDEEFLKETVTLFLEKVPQLQSRIEGAIRRGDLEALEDSAHALKGSVGNFGARAAWDAAQRLEDMGGKGELAGAGRTYRELDAELDRLTSSLVAFLEEKHS